jgi:3-dehydroquinate dehydratase-2
MTKPIYVLNGPNLNLLGEREPAVYGHETLADIEGLCAERASTFGFSIVFRQSNHEGVLVDWLHEARTAAAAVVFNPGAYTHTSIALHDAVKALDAPLIEIHLSNPSARESFRRKSFIAPVATGVIAGLGARGYALAVEAAILLARKSEPAKTTAAQTPRE